MIIYVLSGNLVGRTLDRDGGDPGLIPGGCRSLIIVFYCEVHFTLYFNSHCTTAIDVQK